MRKERKDCTRAVPCARAHPENAFTFSRNLLLMPPKFCTRVPPALPRIYMDTYMYKRTRPRYICIYIYFIKYVTSRIFTGLSSPPHTSRTGSHVYIAVRGSLKIKVNLSRFISCLHSRQTVIITFFIINILNANI